MRWETCFLFFSSTNSWVSYNGVPAGGQGGVHRADGGRRGTSAWRWTLPSWPTDWSSPGWASSSTFALDSATEETNLAVRVDIRSGEGVVKTFFLTLNSVKKRVAGDSPGPRPSCPPALLSCGWGEESSSQSGGDGRGEVSHRLLHGERAELATEEYLPVTPIMKGFVILKKNPDY